MSMTIAQIKEWRNHKRFEDTYGLGCAHAIDTLLADVCRLEQTLADVREIYREVDKRRNSLTRYKIIATKALERIAKPCHYGSADQICDVMQAIARTALERMKGNGN